MPPTPVMLIFCKNTSTLGQNQCAILHTRLNFFLKHHLYLTRSNAAILFLLDSFPLALPIKTVSKALIHLIDLLLGERMLKKGCSVFFVSPAKSACSKGNATFFGSFILFRAAVVRYAFHELM
jgi:hypothetical protein